VTGGHTAGSIPAHPRKLLNINNLQERMEMQITRKSQITGIEHTLEIPCTPEQLAQYRAGLLIQVAMPNISKDMREFIMTGITPEEWKDFFGDESDE
jgi:hypothetical protein